MFAYEDNIADPTASVSLVVKKVLDRMASRGKATPHENTIRPVVAAVLNRVRSE